MCAVSVVLNYGIKQPDYYWDKKKLDDFDKLIAAARRFDIEAGEPDCELEEKIEWLKELREKLATIQ